MSSEKFLTLAHAGEILQRHPDLPNLPDFEMHQVVNPQEIVIARRKITPDVASNIESRGIASGLLFDEPYNPLKESDEVTLGSFSDGGLLACSVAIDELLRQQITFSPTQLFNFVKNAPLQAFPLNKELGSDFTYHTITERTNKQFGDGARRIFQALSITYQITEDIGPQYITKSRRAAALGFAMLIPILDSAITDYLSISNYHQTSEELDAEIRKLLE